MSAEPKIEKNFPDDFPPEFHWIEFETRARHMIANLIKPLSDRAELDRRFMEQVEKETMEMAAKVSALETVVLNQKRGRNIFDDIDDKIISV